MSATIHLFTIGFTRKTAEQFFELLRVHQIDVLLDTRLKPNTQLSGFARGVDLPYFLRELMGAAYRHMPLMSPTDELLSRYRSDHLWDAYEQAFTRLLWERDLIATLDRAWWAAHRACLLCSEHEPEHCHRRLVADYMAAHWSEVKVQHLL